MAVIGNSVGFTGRVDKAELDQHVFFSRAQPDAYAFHCTNNYRPWAKEWGFCIPLAQYETWPGGEYEVDLVTEFTIGEMLGVRLYCTVSCKTRSSSTRIHAIRASSKTGSAASRFDSGAVRRTQQTGKAPIYV